jgi:hypothetical protein
MRLTAQQYRDSGKSIAEERRRERTITFVVLAMTVRKDVDTARFMGEGDDRWVDTYSFSLPNLNTTNGGSPNFTVRYFYVGVTAAGTASANQTLYTQSGQGGNSLVLVTGVTLIVDGATNAVIIQKDLYGLAGASLGIHRQYGEDILIPIETILTVGFTALSNTAGVLESFDPRWYRTSIENPLAVIQPTDQWSAYITNANGTTVTAATAFIVHFVGQQLRVNQ